MLTLSEEAAVQMEILKNKKKSGKVRRASAEMLGEIGDANVVKPLIEVIERERKTAEVADRPFGNTVFYKQVLPSIHKTLNTLAEEAQSMDYCWFCGQNSANAAAAVEYPMHKIVGDFTQDGTMNRSSSISREPGKDIVRLTQYELNMERTYSESGDTPSPLFGNG